MIHRAVCYFLTCDSLIYRRKDKRLYWCDLPLLSLWKKCTVLGIWNSRWIMHYALHALGPSDKFLLSVYWGACISSSRVCCCLLCLWIPPSTKNKVQPSGSTMRRFDDTLILPSVCDMPRVQGDPRENRQWHLFSS
uniref:Uncharacterized protein n=1 Tax=Triticum urartu TaxID=4572 RepID=A0A8R7TTI6_TRIUA